jgi:hypothetical protein
MARVSERFGSKLGGLLVALPSTALVGLGFIAWGQGQSAISEATSVMPATVAASTIFLVVFSLLYRYGLLIAYFSGIIIWFGLNIPVVALKLHNFGIALLISAILLSISITFFHHQPHRTLAPLKADKLDLIIRAVFAGSFIALAVACSKLLGPVWGGLFASFPAAFSAVVLIFSRAHGSDFTASVSRTMVNGGMVNVVFVSAVHFLVSSLGSAASILTGYLICLVFAAFSYRYIIPRI